MRRTTFPGASEWTIVVVVLVEKAWTTSQLPTSQVHGGMEMSNEFCLLDAPHLLARSQTGVVSCTLRRESRVELLFGVLSGSQLTVPNLQSFCLESP